MWCKGKHVMSILLDILVCCFYHPIHFLAIWQRIVMLYLEAIAQFFHHFVVQIGPIISNNVAWQTISIDQIPFDESDHYIPCYTSIRCYFNPFSEIINGN